MIETITTAVQLQNTQLQATAGGGRVVYSGATATNRPDCPNNFYTEEYVRSPLSNSNRQVKEA